MSSENGVPADGRNVECYGNRRLKEKLVRIVVDEDNSKQCGEKCHFNSISGWCPLFYELRKNTIRCTQCIKEFGE